MTEPIECFTPNNDPNKEQKIADAAALIASSKHLVFFTGAGISTESGIPDFRGPEGVWTLRDQGKKSKRKISLASAQPNNGHFAIRQLQELGLLKLLITQNTDNLHPRSGIHPDLLVQLHGNSMLMKCLNCNTFYDRKTIGWDMKKFGKGYRSQKIIPGQPRCRKCLGRIISSVINFGDPMPENEMDIAMEHSEKADVFVVVGSSLSVAPAFYYPEQAIDKTPAAKLILINLGQTPFDDRATIHISAKSGETLKKIVTKVTSIVKEK